IRFHDLRHTCATYLLRSGVPARVVQEILGHSEIRVTLDTYTHVLPVMLESVTDTIDRALRG
ncbi:MAG: tyrosine-type recombinase/integrase, partial [Dehalococcoidia bacterium]|nr:tyrosine-type recombinase/integrase [Dehalococcoidia bacterium]